MKRPWKNPLRPIAGCMVLFAIIGLFFYLNADWPRYYQSNDDHAPNDCDIQNDDYVATTIWCESEWVDSAKICDYYKSAHEQKDCIQLSATYGSCHKSGLELIHVCEY